MAHPSGDGQPWSQWVTKLLVPAARVAAALAHTLLLV